MWTAKRCKKNATPSSTRLTRAQCRPEITLHLQHGKKVLKSYWTSACIPRKSQFTVYIYDNLDDCTNPTLNQLRRFGWTIRPIGIPPKKTLQNTRRGTGIWHRPWRIKGFVKDSLRDVKGVIFCQGIINWKWFIGLILKALTEWASSNMDFGLQCTRTWVLSDSQLFNP